MKLLTALTLLTLPFYAASAADAPKTLLAEPGKLLLSDDLTTAPDGKDWRAAKGKWEVEEGVLSGAEKPEDKHGAVTRRALAFENAVIQYEVRLDGAKMTTLSINDAKEHMCRVLLNPTGFTVQKDDHDHDGPDKAVVFGRQNIPLKTGEWHTVVLEIVGDTMLATVDGAHAIYGSDPLLATKKANLGFTVSGQSTSFRNLRVWDATLKKDWEKTKLTIKPAPVPKVAGKRAAK
jgi:hypothetical protein